MVIDATDYVKKFNSVLTQEKKTHARYNIFKKKYPIRKLCCSITKFT